MEAQVTIWCTVFNHEKFLRKCLDGFVMQKTNFPFIAIIHDDASTDKSAEIIKEYEKKYPDIIKPIYERENQYSRGVNKLNSIMMNNLHTKYFAVCEGDDYWSNPNKLQIQYNYMEQQPECSICLHNTVIHDLSEKTPDRNFFAWNKIHELTDKEVFFGWHVHTSSYFVRTEKYIDLPKVFWNVWCGDYVFLTYLFTKGKVVALPDVMSVYNFANMSGVTMKNSQTIETIKRSLITRKDYLINLLNFVDAQYHAIIKKRIYEIDLTTKMCVYNYIRKNMPKKKRINMRHSIAQDRFYHEWKTLQGKKGKISAYLKYETSYGQTVLDVYKKIKHLVKK